MAALWGISEGAYWGAARGEGGGKWGGGGVLSLNRVLAGGGGGGGAYGGRGYIILKNVPTVV